MEDEWYSGGDPSAGGPVGGAIAGAGHPAGMATARGAYGDSFTPPTSHKGMMPGQVGSWIAERLCRGLVREARGVDFRVGCY